MESFRERQGLGEKDKVRARQVEKETEKQKNAMLGLVAHGHNLTYLGG